MANLQLEDIKKSFGSIDVLHGIDLNVSDGEFVVFVGPSGCGKSTLLRVIAGLEDPSSGDIGIGGDRMTFTQPSERGIAMVFQSYALYPHMTVEQNMSFSLRIAKVHNAEMEQKVLEAARVLQLEPLLDRYPRELSGGQRQRVAIGRAIVREPDVFLFDEPLSNLDAELRVEMRLELSKLHRQLKATIIYVTHDQVEAMTLADKIVVMRAGRIEQFGTPIELYSAPANMFVAGFIGSPSMNFLDGEITSTGPEEIELLINELDNLKLILRDRKVHVEIGQKVKIGIRPEHFEPDAENQVSLEVDATENLGGISYTYAKTKTGNSLTIETRNSNNSAAPEGAGDFPSGFPSDRVYLFDATTEWALEAVR